MSQSPPLALLELYEVLLHAGGMSADSEGFISTDFGHGKFPTQVKDKRLALPTQVILTSPSVATINFHPLRESASRGESEVMTHFRKHVVQRLNGIVAALTEDLLDLAIKTDLHAKLTPDQAPFLSVVKAANDTMLTNLIKINNAAVRESDTPSLVHLYLKKGGHMGGRKYNKVCSVNFPIYEELKKEPEKGKSIIVAGQKLRHADRETLLNLYRFIFPDIDKEQAYWSGSESTLAPTLEALMDTITKLARHINEHVALFSSYLEDPDNMSYDLDYVDTLANLEALRAQIMSIPPQEGNEGSIPNRSATGAVLAAPVVAPAVTHGNPFVTPPVSQLQSQQPVQVPVVNPATSSPAVSSSPYLTPLEPSAAPAPAAYQSQYVAPTPAPAPVAPVSIAPPTGNPAPWETQARSPVPAPAPQQFVSVQPQHQQFQPQQPQVVGQVYATALPGMIAVPGGFMYPIGAVPGQLPQQQFQATPYGYQPVQSAPRPAPTGDVNQLFAQNPALLAAAAHNLGFPQGGIQQQTYQGGGLRRSDQWNNNGGFGISGGYTGV